ncbi:MAG: hypothetical protein HY861_03045 [Chlamydiia bacterium]|nr:hypothetical protein [Chlamydiia bacterium]
MYSAGLQIDKPFVRTALIRTGRRGFTICSLKSNLLSAPDDVKRLYSGKFRGRITSGLSAKDLLIRPMELKVTRGRHIEQALSFQLDSTTCLQPDDVITTPYAIKKGIGKTEALLCTATKEAIRSRLHELDKLQIQPDFISSACLGLIQYIRWRYPRLDEAFLIDLGSSECSCVLMCGGEFKKSYSLSMGIEALLSALWEDRKKLLLPKEVEGVARQIDLLQMRSHLNPHLWAELEGLQQELGRVIASFHRLSGKKPVLFTGYIDAFRNLPEFLSQNLKETACLDLTLSPLDSEEVKYAVAIGLAIPPVSAPLQLLQKEFFPKKIWRRAGYYALILYFSSILLGGGLCLIGKKILQERAEKAIQSVQPMLDHWDPELKPAIFSHDFDAVDRWIAEVEAHNKEYPYILQAPRLTDVLSWINETPLLLHFQKEGDPLEILQIRYQLVEFPKIQSPQAKYLAKVDLEFNMKNPTNARKFHEFLLQGDSLIDPARGIEWNLQNNGYKTSFFLKNHIPDMIQSSDLG